VAVPWLGLFVASLSLQASLWDLWRINGTETDFLRILRFSPVSTIPPLIRTCISSACLSSIYPSIHPSTHRPMYTYYLPTYLLTSLPHTREACPLVLATRIPLFYSSKILTNVGLSALFERCASDSTKSRQWLQFTGVVLSCNKQLIVEYRRHVATTCF
jgi:hypothetical protein